MKNFNESERDKNKITQYAHENYIKIAYSRLGIHVFCILLFLFICFLIFSSSQIFPLQHVCNDSKLSIT